MNNVCKETASRSRLLKTLILLILLPACAAPIPATRWKSPLYHDHPLVGRLWHSESAQFVTAVALWQDIEGAKFLILGEKHDNPDHHNLQSALLRDLIGSNLLSGLVMEMLDSGSDEALQNLATLNPESQDELHELLNWDAEGWDWNFYGPLIVAALRGNVPIHSGNIDEDTVARVYREPTPGEIAAVFPDSAMNRLTEDVDESHCGLLPESQFPAMVRVQQTRDYTMAKQMLNARQDELQNARQDKLQNARQDKLQNARQDKLTLLLAGNYHARHDLGVPNYLLAQEPTLKRSDILTVAFMEVRPGEESPGHYLDRFSEQTPYDYLWFTPALSSEDYCDALRP